MWLVMFLIGVVAVVLYMLFLAAATCPNCGIQLTETWSGELADSCVCGWRRR